MTSNKKWNFSKLNQELMHSTILKRIQGLDIPQFDIKDSICWALHSSGEFLTKSATWLAHGTKSLNEPDWEFKWIWKLDIMPKIQNFPAVDFPSCNSCPLPVVQARIKY